MIGPIPAIAPNVHNNSAVVATSVVSNAKDVISAHDAVTKAKNEKRVKDEEKSKHKPQNKKRDRDADDKSDNDESEVLTNSYNILQAQEQCKLEKNVTTHKAHESYKYFIAEESKD